MAVGGAILGHTRLKRVGWCLLVGGLAVVILTVWQTLAEVARLQHRDTEQKETISTLLIAPPARETARRTPRNVSGDVVIREPPQGTRMPQEGYVAGTISDPGIEVWLVVHPLDVSAYWVQAAANVSRAGNWRCKVYLGRSGNTDSGKEFEIVALGKPVQPLKEGMVLPDWPEAEWSSDVLMVLRE